MLTSGGFLGNQALARGLMLRLRVKVLQVALENVLVLGILILVRLQLIELGFQFIRLRFEVGVVRLLRL
jgi:hypothetical protein